MKQILTVFFCLFLSITGYAENKIKMVTYFPVPYVAYSKVNATDQMDIGLTTSCIMNLGCTESGNAGLRPLNVTNTVLKKGRLDLNTATAVSGSTASIGSGSGSGSMNFNSNLRVNTLNDGVSVEANNITVDTLKLFPNRITTDFPSCASTGAPGAPNISWKKLKLKSTEEVYLMCGNAKEAAPDCSDRTYKLAHKSTCCPSASYSDTDCWKYVAAKNTYGGQERVTVSGGSSFSIKNSSVGCYNSSNVVIPSGKTFSETVGPSGYVCPRNVGSGVECPVVGYVCAYVTDFNQIGSSGVNCYQSGTSCSCTYSFAWGYRCYAPSSSGGYQKNGW